MLDEAWYIWQKDQNSVLWGWPLDEQLYSHSIFSSRFTPWLNMIFHCFFFFSNSGVLADCSLCVHSLLKRLCMWQSAAYCWLHMAQEKNRFHLLVELSLLTSECLLERKKGSDVYIENHFHESPQRREALEDADEQLLHHVGVSAELWVWMAFHRTVWCDVWLCLSFQSQCRSGQRPLACCSASEWFCLSILEGPGTHRSQRLGQLSWNVLIQMALSQSLSDRMVWITLRSAITVLAGNVMIWLIGNDNR